MDQGWWRLLGGATAVDAQAGPTTGTKSTPRIPWWGSAVFVVVAALAIVTWTVTEQGVNNQSTALLKNNAAQIELLLQSALNTVQGELRSVAFITANAGNSSTVLAQQSAGLRAQPAVTVAVVDSSGPAPRIVAVAGSALTVGETLSPALAAVVRNGATAMAGDIVQLGGQRMAALSASLTVSPNVAAIELTPLTTKAVPNRTGPYSKVYVNLYASPKPDASELFLTTYGPGPLPMPVATSPLKVGALNWLIAVSPKDPLIGGAAAAAPWLILGIVLLVALLLGVFVELLARRQHYARALVEERTAELVQAQRTLVRQERLAAIGEMASVVSHELRNPLSAVINDLFLVRRRAEPELNEGSERHLANAEREVYRAARLSEDLLAYAREREPQLAEVDLEALVAEVLENSPAPPGVSVTVDAAVRFQADPALLTQVLENVVTNAYQAISDGGTVQLSGRREDGSTVIVVEDSGAGIDPEVGQRLFEPFFTTKEGGTGLGLAIVHRLVDAHGGEATIDNGQLGGARISIRIPGQGRAS